MMNSYHSIIIIILIVGAFAGTKALARFGLISAVTHRRIWNLALALFAFVSAILGLLLAITIDTKSILSWYSTALWIHVEFGIAMAIVALFHFFWHFRYYLLMFKKTN